MNPTVGIPRRGIALTPDRASALQGPADQISEPALREAAELMASPICEIRVQVTSPTGARRLSVHLSESAAVVLMSRADQTPELAVVTPGSVPAVIAKTLQLGPGSDDPDSPNAGRKFRLPLPDLESLAGDGHPVSARLAASPAGPVLSGNDWCMWSIDASRLAPSGKPESVRFDAIGAVGKDWWQIEQDGRRAILQNTMGTEIWGFLINLVAPGNV